MADSQKIYCYCLTCEKPFSRRKTYEDHFNASKNKKCKHAPTRIMAKDKSELSKLKRLHISPIADHLKKKQKVDTNENIKMKNEININETESIDHTRSEINIIETESGDPTREEITKIETESSDPSKLTSEEINIIETESKEKHIPENIITTSFNDLAVESEINPSCSSQSSLPISNSNIELLMNQKKY